ncbi:peptide ABC transporter substrate-binding protein [Saccharococcus caldoxylosilyticus]|jgi:oligopeptide transport system substrate-binding protein|uniref:Oligopeptide ABC transporter substrate-binding protein n=1 Tax=Parageobacillus caldoxylosilyticus NBRC 107762 TaxID=1220594 RepID=A0A023DID8_9BACL|nr:peptide ABC transporter substrate-binding protein [Parageobacillus caldoxylosilyticus]MBB3854172.1 oligopeptide transport system substrate-binding protein [Parageobacillus caldoxylosilyticus]OQP02993.1 ABC transporter substrate-binding protein [Geobacillus sp. 44B]BDG42369.1 oligopeptide-binding protein OppA [Parageobacillus caldoxylosilyticus]GAJ41069.1 oligopeptide ABC transporter substrate-binding protein [Parageobacillus caldoxylosilyticus NBRC 107762]
MKKRLSVLFSLMLVLSLFLSACGGFQKGDESAGEKGKSGDKAANVPQELHINIKTEPFSLNPGLANDSVSSNVLNQTFEGLTRIKNGKPELAMAESYEVSKDLKTYTFKLRDAKWSNGDPVTAKDFEYAWKWALDPKNQSQYAYQLYYIKNGQAFNEGKAKAEDVGVKAIDDKTLQVTLENPTPYFLELTAFYTYFPVNSKIAQKNPKWYTNAGPDYTSNGPFKMVSWEHNNKIVLEKNENYWDAKNVKLTKIEMVMVNDTNTELSMFDNGELDWAGMPTGQLPPDSLPKLKEEGKLHVQPIAGVYWYKFNTEKPPLNNVNIRKALAYAIDRKAIVENVTKGEQIPAMAAVPPTMFPENKKGYFKDNDVKKAKEYLKKGLQELGLKDVKDLPPITLSFNTDDQHVKIAQAIQDMWKKNLGVEVKLENAEWAVYIDKLHSGDYQIGRMGWLGDFNDPINFLELFRDKKGGNNDTNWENPKYKQLLIDSQKEKDPEKRKEMLKQAEAILMDEMPIAPIYFYTNTWVQKDNLKGVEMSGLGDVQFKWAYFE